jgi:hypothetical protein
MCNPTMSFNRHLAQRRFHRAIQRWRLRFGLPTEHIQYGISSSQDDAALPRSALNTSITPGAGFV